jgi:hypothetical protein
LLQVRCDDDVYAVLQAVSFLLQHIMRSLSSIAWADRHGCNYLLQVGSDDDGYAVRLRFGHFLRYCTAVV